MLRYDRSRIASHRGWGDFKLDKGRVITSSHVCKVDYGEVEGLLLWVGTKIPNLMLLQGDVRLRWLHLGFIVE